MHFRYLFNFNLKFSSVFDCFTLFGMVLYREAALDAKELNFIVDKCLARCGRDFLRHFQPWRGVS